MIQKQVNLSNTQKYRNLSIIQYSLLGIATVSLIVLNYWNPDFLVLGVTLWIGLISYIVGIIIGFIKMLRLDYLVSNNPIKSLESNKEYFDKVGFALFTGGLVASVTTDKIATSYGLIIIGATCVIISILNAKKLERFNESLKKTKKSS